MRLHRHLVPALVTLTVSLAATQPALPGWTVVDEGVEHLHLRRAATEDGTWNINALRIDMARARLDVVRARDAAVGLETTSAIARRLNAAAAINGGYFKVAGDFAGDSTGTVQIDGRLLSEPDRGRASVGLLRGGRSAQLLFGHLEWRATIASAGGARRIDGLNRARGPHELIVFTSDFGERTRTDGSGIEIAVRATRVASVHDLSGGIAIPSDGFVVSARGRARDWAQRALRPGTRVAMNIALRPTLGAREPRWDAAEDILAAGPRLVSAGRVDITDRRERMAPTFANDLHPRTAIASLADGRALLVVVDGRRPPERVGISLANLARLLIELGAREAINLDGGGSTTMVIQDKVVNYPTDVTGERLVSDAIVVRRIE